MTLQQANSLIERADNLFHRAAKADGRRTGAKDEAYKSRLTHQIDACRTRAEKLLEPLGISVDYPGLYPSFLVAGGTYYTTESAVSAALEANKGQP